MRLTRRLLNAAHPVSHATQAPPLVYNLGLSYAAKYSPPFVPATETPESLGFAGKPTKLGKWVDAMRSLQAGRGVLRAREGGWDEGLQEEVQKWGAGEDFFGVVDSGQWVNIAVSDGVGGWAPHYDPALYAQALMYHYASAVASSPSLAPWDALQKAYEAINADEAVKAGSATAVGVSLGQTGKGRAVNLGDSGFSILRRGQTVFETQSQTHFFNCPYQLSKVPKEMRNGAITDLPAHGQRYEFDLQPGDVVVLYTDGLSDNLPAAHVPALDAAVLRVLDEEANAHLEHGEKAAEHARLLADVLVAAGRSAMARTGDEEAGQGWRTPFDIESEKEGKRYKGGKVDDITVLTAVVSERLV
ncbi:Protein phosphatase 2C 7 [Vanrija albida]|uniref:Protein phosphatase n=1 Tax=Vanrija albida TaxID=181172 RepID=A0ABR3PZA4_9TREE